MYSCFYFDDQCVEKIEALIAYQIHEIWIPATFTYCDKSLMPFKGRKSNPHHIFIMKKPYPYGVKVYFNFFFIFFYFFINFFYRYRL